MEDLNKNQIILLCILISFIVSIATGIMTTALLNQAPVELTQTVNRVVERTIQSVTQIPTVTNPNPTPTQVQTVVVSEDDSVTKAVAKNTPAIVRIQATSGDASIDALYSLGIVVTSDGIIAADKQYISPVMTYTATMFDGTKVPLVPITLAGSEVSFFKAKPIKPFTFSVASLAANDLQLGQTVVVIGGASTNAVSVGRVVSLPTKNNAQVGTSTPTTYVSSIETDISPRDIVSGAPIISLSGDVVGMSLSNISSSKSYLPSAIIKKELSQIQVAK